MSCTLADDLSLRISLQHNPSRLWRGHAPYPSTPERGQVGPPAQDGAAGGLPADNGILVSWGRETSGDLQQRLLSQQPALRAEHTRARSYVPRPLACWGGVACHRADADKIQ